MSDSSNRIPDAASKRSKTKAWLKFAVELGPLILFFIANARPKIFAPALAPFLPPPVLGGPNASLFTATLILMAAVAAALAVSFVATRRLPAVPLMTAALVLVFGALTIYLQDAAFIKMKPTVLYASFGVALTGGLALNKPVLPIIFDNAMALSERGWRLLTWRWGSFFFALALLNEIVWRTQPIPNSYKGVYVKNFTYRASKQTLAYRIAGRTLIAAGLLTVEREHRTAIG